jgi:hypothetical protein
LFPADAISCLTDAECMCQGYGDGSAC